MVYQRESYSFHQLDKVEHFASKKRWEYYRVAQDESMRVVKGRVLFLVIKVEYLPKTETLNLQCVMNIEPLLHQMNEFYNLVN